MKQDQNFQSNLKVRLDSQSGQATIEYILLIVVSISMLMMAKGLFAGVNNFINSYIGNYFTCLMDNGELPGGVGSGSTSVACKAEFSFNKGAVLTGGGSTGGSSSSSSQNSSASANSKNKNGSSTNSSSNANSSNASSKNGSGSDSDESAGKKASGGGGSSGGSNSAYANGTLRRSGGFNVADGGSNADAKVKVLDEEDVLGGSGSRSGRDSVSRITSLSYRNRYKAITGQYYDEIEKKEARKQPKGAVSRKLAVAQEEGNRPGPRKSEFVPRPAEVVRPPEAADAGFSFGYLFKWLIIAGMIVAIIIFFGGQVLNYSNSDS